MKQLGMFHFAEKDLVIPARIRRHRFAFHHGDGIFQQRDSEFSFEVETQRPLGIPFREDSRHLLLILTEHTYPERL